MNPSITRSTARSTVRRFAVALMAAALFATSAPARVRADDAAWLAKAAPVRIMALGDSITAGVGKNGVDIGTGGYRGVLERLLDEGGYHYSMTGSLSGYSRDLKERAHEGHPGYVLRSFPSDEAPQLYGEVTKHALDAYDPDVILLMAGTNDLLRYQKGRAGYTLANIAQSLDMELAQIFYLKPHVDVIVAGVVSSPNVAACAIATFDGTGNCDGDAAVPSVRSLVDQYAARGFRIEFAGGMDAAVPRDRAHFPDGTHPCGDGGYAEVARVFMRAIETVTAGDDNRGALAGAPIDRPH